MSAGVDGALYKSSLSGVSALLLQAASLDSTNSDITSARQQRNADNARRMLSHPMQAIIAHAGSSVVCVRSSVLEDCEWPSSRVSQLLAFFDSVRPLYRSAVLPSLSSFSSTVPHLTSASYQLDYYLRSNLAEQIRQPVLFLHLNTTAAAVGPADSGTGEGVVSFSATAEELHDMLAKVKEAVRAAQQRHDD